MARSQAASRSTFRSKELAIAPPDRILNAAAALFWRKGYAASSTRELATVLGMEKASLYYHFRQKEDLLYAICVTTLEHGIRTVTKAVSNAPSPDAKIRELIRAHLSAILHEPDRYATTLTEMRSLSTRRRKHVLELRDTYESLIRSILRDGQIGGIIRPDIPAKYLALSLLDLLNYSMFWFRQGRSLSPERLAELFTTIFLDGTGTANRGPVEYSFGLPSDASISDSAQ